jgi:phosphatidate cytidylyltransferase
MIWGNDIAAYFGGRTFGKHKMAPHISPKKTWEGFASGFIGSFIGFGFAVLILNEGNNMTWYSILAMVLLTGIFGPIGDLTASKFKRAAEIKDSSTLLPGHGGFYDRFDSTLVVAPAILIYLRLSEAFGFSIFM